VIDDLGRILDTAALAATRDGYRRLGAWLGGFGELVAVGVEGCGSWGAGLSRYLAARGVRVVEVNRPNRQNRRRRGKSDTVDAEAAARAVLAGDATVLGRIRPAQEHLRTPPRCPSAGTRAPCWHHVGIKRSCHGVHQRARVGVVYGR
jgi:transposase